MAEVTTVLTPEQQDAAMRQALATVQGGKRPDLAGLYARLAANSEQAPDYGNVSRVGQSRMARAAEDQSAGSQIAMLGGKHLAPYGRQLTESALAEGKPLRMNEADIAYQDPTTGEMVENPANRQRRAEKALIAEIAGGERALSAEAARADAKAKADADRAMRATMADDKNALLRELGAGRRADAAAARLAKTGVEKALPAAQSKAWINNNTALNRIDETLQLIEDNPDAFGAQNYLPDALTQRLPGQSFGGGVGTRAPVADIGSLKIHDRSGAAVTVGEMPRLVPFIPKTTDTSGVVATKLKNLKREFELMNNEIVNYAGDMGYKAPTSAPRQAGASDSFATGGKIRTYNPKTGKLE